MKLHVLTLVRACKIDRYQSYLNTRYTAILVFLLMELLGYGKYAAS